MARAGSSEVVGATLAGFLPQSRLRSRLGVAVVDQGVSAGTNVLFTLVAARELDTRAFGVLSVLYVCWLLTAGIARALCGEPALVVTEAVGHWAKRAFGSGLACASVCSALIAVGGSIALPAYRPVVLVFAVLLPGMVLQDVGRYVAFAKRRPIEALQLDLAWAAAQCGLLATMAATGRFTPLTLLVAWAGAGALGGLYAVAVLIREVPKPSLGWVRETWYLASRYLATFATTTGTAHASGLGLGVIAGVESVGALRGVQVGFGALNVLFAGVIAALVPEGARQDMASAKARARLIRLSAGLVAVAAVVTLVGVVLPDSIGGRILGETWPAAHDLVLPIGIAAIGGAALAGADIALRSARAVKTSLGVHLRLAPLQLLLPVGGAVLAGASGYSWGLATAMIAAAVLWWHTYGRFCRESRA